MTARASVPVLIAALALGGCMHRWNEVSHTAVAEDEIELRLSDVRLEERSGDERVLYVHRVRYPHLEGWNDETEREERVDLGTVDRFFVRETHPGGILAITVGIATAVLSAIYFAAYLVAFP